MIARQFLFDLLHHTLLLRVMPSGSSEGCAAVGHCICSCSRVCMLLLMLMFFVLPRQLFLYLLRQPFLLSSSALPVVFRLHTYHIQFIFASIS